MNSLKVLSAECLSYFILNISPHHIVSSYRNLERCSLKIVNYKCHLSFNETCINNNLLPTYTNVKIHDDAATSERFVIDFRLKLVERQIDEQKALIHSLQSKYNEELQRFRALVGCELKVSPYLVLLDRVAKRKSSQLQEIQRSKLSRMYGAHILLKQNVDSVVNLSGIDLDPEILNIFSYGMNCHLRRKYDHTKKKVNVEMLYDDVKEKEKSKNIIIVNEEELKSDLETFGMKSVKEYLPDVLTGEQYRKVREFNRIDSIVTRKADKSNAFVILDKSYYNDQINSFLDNSSKFSRIPKDPTEQLKRELNKLISAANNSTDSFKLQKLMGRYEPGYIYGNPKIHKRLIDPPLRPIISQIGTVTYDLSKKLNSLIVKYMPRKYSVKSSYEFLSLLRSKHPGDNILASLDVENLFTNVPVQETIDIIIHNVYNHGTLQPPTIPADILRQLLFICTTRTPFRSVNGELFVQREGVSMGSALGPTFADYYMCNLENSTFENQPELKPDIYVRYVDDCFLLVNNEHILSQIKNTFESNSVLKFTYELEKNYKLSFLDTVINRIGPSFSTSVFIKPTNYGQVVNYKSICPERYKEGVIKTLLYRGYNHCSNWQIFDEEIQRIKQLLTNNNFPMQLIDRTIHDFINRKLKPSSVTTSTNTKFFFQNQMSSNYKVEEKRLKEIFYKNVKPVTAENSVSLNIYYRNPKLHNLFIKNKPNLTKSTAQRSHVVYQYTCNQAGCNSAQSYVGYTTCTLAERFRMHTHNGSIKKHLVEHHNFRNICKEDILAPTKILKSCTNRRELFITEAVLIKDLRPQLNSQDEGCDRILKIFKH